MRRRRVRRARPMAIPRSPCFPWRPWLGDLPEILAPTRSQRLARRRPTIIEQPGLSLKTW